jgi:hypothetical protein
MKNVKRTCPFFFEKICSFQMIIEKYAKILWKKKLNKGKKKWF